MSRIQSVFSLSLIALTAVTGLARAQSTAAASAYAYGEVNFLAARIRAADARFRDASEAAREGYTPIPCASGPDGGSMGVHYVNGDLLKSGKIDIAHPQAVMYEPEADGTMALVAVEYISLKGPTTLEGHLFNFNPAPNRYGLDAYYDLHVWAWRANPTGTFSEMNPNVSCDAMPLNDAFADPSHPQ